MHIPDGFLSTSVWATLNVVSIPVVGYMARCARTNASETRVPLLGVLGAFVFGAQMINFPVAPGASGHLLGSALLAFTVGPAAATVVMTAVLVIQALVFQDGGVLALGANVFNLAVAGVLAAYAPYWLAGGSRFRTLVMFVGSFLSVSVASGLALLQIMLSGIGVPPAIFSAALIFFFVGAVVEGLITVAVVRSIEKINPDWVRQPERSSGAVMKALAAGAAVMGCAGFLVASTKPDSLETIAAQLGIAQRTTTLLSTPMADYQASWVSSSSLAKAAAGTVGLCLVFLLCMILGRMISSRRSA
jgi:cobalt/nickel transport system permease protein